MTSRYVLREMDDSEISRLGFQHELWREETQFAINESGIHSATRVMDIGCGPGHASLDLLGILGPGGIVYAIDSSQKFIDYIRSHGFSNITALNIDVEKELFGRIHAEGQIDAVFCRWVLMFLNQSEKVVKEIYQLLRPGGKFISMEYFNFREIALSPRSMLFDHLYQNVWQLIKNAGGNPDIGGTMGEMMKITGFRHVKTFPVQKQGSPTSDVWEWLSQNNPNHQNLVKAGLITEKELSEFFADWKERSKDSSTVANSPPLMITIGEK